MPPAEAASPPRGGDDAPQTAEAPGPEAATQAGAADGFDAAAGDASQPQAADGQQDPSQPEAAAEPADPEAELREQAGRYLDLAQRTQADFDNYRKRMA